jgi:hypothetical protein
MMHIKTWWTKIVKTYYWQSGFFKTTFNMKFKFILSDMICPLPIKFRVLMFELKQ